MNMVLFCSFKKLKSLDKFILIISFIRRLLLPKKHVDPEKNSAHQQLFIEQLKINITTIQLKTQTQ